jgi:predicted metalloprotease with PDZ domain
MTIASTFALLALTTTAPSPRYELHFSHANPRLVTVHAEFVLTDTLLRMVPYGAEHLPDGWRTFVRHESLTTANGQPVALIRLDERRWRVAAPLGTAVRLRYDIAIEHDLQPWTPNAREAAYARAWGTFAVGRALFIYNSATDSGITIVVRTAEGWPVSTAWQPVGNAADNTYRVASWGEAINSVVFAGRAERFEVQEGTVRVSYVVGGDDFATSTAVLRESTSRILRHYLTLFGGGPPAAHLLVVINPDSTVHGGGGGVFRQSISMTFDRAPTARNILGWGHTLSHELFHIWNASAMVRAGEEEEWMVEGIADYYAVLTMTRLGYFPVSAWTFKAGQWINQYLTVAGQISLRQAGLQEWQAPGPTMLYMGGATAALSLDVAIRAADPAGNGLDGAMRSLYQRLANSGTGFTIADLQQEAVRAGLRDAPTFFSRYVLGRDTIPVQPALETFALTREGDRLRLDPPSVAQATARTRYFGALADMTTTAGALAQPAAGTRHQFTSSMTGEATQFTITTYAGTAPRATLESTAGTYPSTRMRVDGEVTQLEFDVHDTALVVELRAVGSDRFTGTWSIGGQSEAIAGSRRMIHN